MASSVTIPPGSGIICTQEEYARSLANSSIACLTRGESIGMTVVAETSMISLLAVVGLILYIFLNFFRHTKTSRFALWRVIQDPVDLFMLFLFFSEILQALGGAVNIKWVHDGKAEIGTFCTAQGVIQQLGETSVAMTTLVIAVHTFVGVWWRKGLRSMFAARMIMGLVWLFVILSVAIPNIVHRNKKDLYESPGPYWCWIGDRYLRNKIWGEYLWLWMTMGFSLLTYIPLCIRSRELNVNSFIMIAYPLVYSVTVLPLSVVRWIEFIHPRASYPTATFVVESFYRASGIANVLLFSLTRPDSYLFRSRPTTGDYYGRAPSPGVVGNDKMEGRGSMEGGRLGRLPSLSGSTRED